MCWVSCHLCTVLYILYGSFSGVIGHHQITAESFTILIVLVIRPNCRLFMQPCSLRSQKVEQQPRSRRRYTRCALGRLHIAHRRAEVRRSRITPDYFEDKRALIFSRRRRRDRAHSRARGCFEHMDFPEMCKLKCCESALVKIATKLRKQRAN